MRATTTDVLAAPSGYDGTGAAPPITPTCVHASSTTAACSPAAAIVAAAKVAKSLSASSPEVSASYQIRPAPLQDSPPIARAAITNARLGMPLLMCTPPLSSVVTT